MEQAEAHPQHPEVSVIIPCFNQGRYVDDAVESVQSQTFQNFEIVIVNDGSTDPDTIDLLNHYQQPKTAVVHTQNQGLAQARNEGIRVARGKYILPLDADDKIGPDYLELALAVMKKYPNIGIVYCEGVHFGKRDGLVVMPEYSMDKILINNIIFCSALFRKADWEKVGGYNPNMVYGWEDWDFWISLVELGRKVYRIPKVLFYYRIAHTSMIQSMDDQKQFFMRLHAYLNHWQLFKNIAEINLILKIAQLYIDSGVGYNDKQLINQVILGNEERLEFDLKGFRNIQRLRFDPISTCGVINLNRMYLVFKNGRKKEIAEFSANQDKRDGNNYIFTTSDPQFILELNPKDQPQKFVVELTYVSIGQESYQFIIKSQREEIAKLNRLEDIEKQFKDQKLLVNSKEKIIKDKDAHIENIEEALERIRHHFLFRSANFIRLNFIQRPIKIVKLALKGVQILREDGVAVLLDRIKTRIKGSPALTQVGIVTPDYEQWMAQNSLTPESVLEIKKEIAAFKFKPKISIVVPVYNVDEIWLNKAVESIQAQLYDNWELCLADDASPRPHLKKVLQRWAEADDRIKIKLCETNRGIALASNEAANLATGDYIGLLDHDDELSPDALFENVKAINQHPDAGLLYSDEDKIDLEGNRLEPFFKPDYSPDLLLSQNYVCHFTVIKASIFNEIGGFREGFDGSQDHDVILRAIEKSPAVIHIPKILYHWRKIPGSTAAVYDSKSYAWEAGRLAIDSALERRDIAGRTQLGRFQGSYRVRRKLTARPLISIMIPFKDQGHYLKQCLESLLDQTTYPQFEILGINNGSTETETTQVMDYFARVDERIRFLDYGDPFNFSKINNWAAERANGDHLVLMNNDIEITTPEWLEAMLEHSQRPEVGAVGSKLLYPDGRLQHAGIIIGIVGVAGHSHKFMPSSEIGYYARPYVIHNVSALTAAYLMVQKSIYLEMGGLDGDHFGVAYNDVDFCLRLRKAGYLNIYTPFAEAIHHESVSRGYENTPQKLERFNREKGHFEERWQEVIDVGDPYYNPNLTRDHENYSIRLE